jgi:hypothetical protein
LRSSPSGQQAQKTRRTLPICSAACESHTDIVKDERHITPTNSSSTCRSSGLGLSGSSWARKAPDFITVLTAAVMILPLLSRDHSPCSYSHDENRVGLARLGRVRGIRVSCGWEEGVETVV